MRFSKKMIRNLFKKLELILLSKVTCNPLAKKSMMLFCGFATKSDPPNPTDIAKPINPQRSSANQLLANYSIGKIVSLTMSKSSWTPMDK